MNSVIILGDPHLGKNLQQGKAAIGSGLNSRVIDQINLLDWTLDQAIENHSNDIIITGDVFEDPKPHPTIISTLFSWLKKCENNNINVHIILGNHDLIRSGSSFTSCLDIIIEADLPNVHVYKDVNTIFIGSTAFTLMPFRDRKSFSVNSNEEALTLLKNSLVYELALIPKTYKKVIIGHLAIEGSIPVGDEIDDMTNELFCPTDMFEGYDYVWMGHVHKYQIIKKHSPHVCHIGSMDISNFGETEYTKNIVLFDCNSKENNYSLLELPTRSLKKISIVVPKDTIDTTQYVLDEIKNNKIDYNKSIVKVELSLAAAELDPVNKSKIEDALVEAGVFNVASISQSKKSSIIKRDVNNTIDTKMDVSSAIKTYAATYVHEDKKSNFIELAMEIYSEYKEEN